MLTPSLVQATANRSSWGGIAFEFMVKTNVELELAMRRGRPASKCLAQLSLTGTPRSFAYLLALASRDILEQLIRQRALPLATRYRQPSRVGGKMTFNERSTENCPSWCS